MSRSLGVSGLEACVVIPYVRHRRMLLKDHREFNEKWLQQQIAADTVAARAG